ncbi:MAG: class I SAM-dependent methyltransferase [Oscillospiraceae bacterium]|nr:class I SAM-dependent methyltransferase [Oscillospiraceae bacterium]
MEKAYYEAYDERYKTIHSQGCSWAAENRTPIVLESLAKYSVPKEAALLEIGCGEGRDARAVLQAGYNLTATDISPEAIRYCKKTMPEFESHFQVMNCLADRCASRFDFIYAVAVVHMLVLDEDRDGFYRFIRDHLTETGLGLILSMGDGEFEMQSDIRTAFRLQERNHPAGKIMVAGTSCRMVSFSTFEAEIARNGLEIVEKGLTEAMPDFNSLLYAVVKRA